MHQHAAGVHEVERSLLELILDDVVHAHLEIGTVQRLQETRVDVRRDDAPSGPHLATQPCRNRAAPTADLQTVPSLADTQSLEMTDRARVKLGFEGRQARARAWSQALSKRYS